MPTQQKIVNWDFPIAKSHAGLMLGNATTGLEVWGEDAHLKLTIGRADFWDHRGGLKLTAKQNYQDIKQCLEANNEDGIKEIFKTDTEEVSGEPPRPSIMPVGRLDLRLPVASVLSLGTIDIKTGKASILYIRDDVEYYIEIQIDMNSQIFYIKLPENNITVESSPSWRYLSEHFQSISISEPKIIKSDGLNGWIQSLPNDPSLCVGYKKEGNEIWCITERNDDIIELEKSAIEKLHSKSQKGIDLFIDENIKWWSEYWNDIPTISIPNKELELLYYYGLYKFAAFTNPTGVPATLQGPWIEEHRMPPWSSDYHFNINVQMCYWPAYKANRLEHLKPLFDMVWSWRKELQKNAEHFIGVKDGYMLPHAVDDHSVCMGGFWTGVIDHACTAWIAQMMFQYFQYSQDKNFLETIAYPFMNGAMKVYEAMLEKDGDIYLLPLSVSPEYNGSQMNAWGKNASFQLAAIHQLAEHLIEASQILNKEQDSIWEDILTHLPKATLFEDDGDCRIVLWENMDLEESHRHHAHLAAICPFDTIDIYSYEWNDIIAGTLNNWTSKGMGGWSGWCMPWASMIQSRCGNGEMAELILEIWQKVFTNEGGGTLHDSDFGGFTLMGIRNLEKREPSGVMQMDAGMGAIVAIQDMLLHSQRGVNFVMHAIPKLWKNLSFVKMPSVGGFLISAEMVKSNVEKVVVEAKFTGTFKLFNPWGDRDVEVRFIDRVKQLCLNGSILEIEMDQGSILEFTQKTS